MVKDINSFVYKHSLQKKYINKVQPMFISYKFSIILLGVFSIIFDQSGLLGSEYCTFRFRSIWPGLFFFQIFDYF